MSKVMHEKAKCENVICVLAIASQNFQFYTPKLVFSNPPPGCLLFCILNIHHVGLEARGNGKQFEVKI